MTRTQPSDYIQHCVIAGVDVMLRYSDRAVARDPGKSPSIAARLAQPGQECVAEIVQHERPYLAVTHGL